MRNPLSNSHMSSWMKRAVARLSKARQGVSLFARRGRVSPGWLVAVSLCALLAGCISLVKVARHNPSKKVGDPTSASTTAVNVNRVSAKPAQEPQKALAARPKVLVTAKQEKQTAKSPAPLAVPLANSSAPQTPPTQIVLSPPATSIQTGNPEEENSEIGKARASWFFDQRAYPFQHIPEGALQKAIEQRDAMKARQRLAAGQQSAANGIISFPGDALWHLMGPQPINNPFGFNGGSPTASGRVTAIAVDPADATGNTVYIGGAAGGVWKTTDGGSNWTPLTDSQPSLSIGSIAIDPNNHLTIYVGTGEENFNGDAYYGAGILKSTDGGTTWSQVGASTFAQVLGPQTGGAFIGSIAVQPGNSSIILAAVSFFVNGTIGGIYRSADGGTTWTEDAAPQGLAATSVLFESTPNGSNTATAWAAMGDPFGQAVNGIYKSTDSGLTWIKQTGTGANLLPTTNLGRITLGYAPSSGGTATIYAAIADSSTPNNPSGNLLGLFKTTDGGTNWTTLTGPAITGGFCTAQCWYDMAIGVHPTNPNVVVLGGGASASNNFTTLFESIDGGATWTGTGSDNFTGAQGSVHPHVDTHAVVFTPQGTTLRLYVGNDGGVWRTDNPVQGTISPTWVDLNTGIASGGTAPGTGLAITQFYPGISAGISDENYGFGGTQDNDTELFSGSFAWTNLSACGDGGFTAIDPGTPTTVYTTCDKLAGAIVSKSIFNGAVINGPNPNFGAPFAGPNRTFKAADTGINHSDRMQFIPPLAIDDGNPNTLYFGTFQVYQTNDGANTWNVMDIASPDLTAGGGTITNLEGGHHASNLVVAGTSNGKVWETVNAAAGAGATWTEIDRAPLPGRHVTAVRIPRDDTSGNTVYVTFSGFGSCAGCGATPGHVFVTTNGTAATPTWTDISGDLPDIPVNDIVVDHNNNPPFDALYIATDVGVFSCPSPSFTLCANWTVVGDGLPNSPVLGLAMRRSSRILRAATHGRSMWDIQLTDVNPGPVAFLSSLTPAAAFVGDPTTQVTVTGANFSANTQVLFDGVSVGTPTFVSTTQLTISVNSSLLTNGHVYAVSLSDSQGADPGSGPFAVMNPVLNATSMTPNNTTTYTPVTLQFSGGAAPNFVSGTVVTFNGISLTGGTVTGGGTGFSVPVPVSLLTVAMPVTVTITNPLPGGGPTPATSFAFTITANPNPLAIFNPSPIVLGPVALGGSTSLTTLQLSNPGGATLNVTAESITGTNKSDFSFVAPTLVPSCNFETTGTATLTSGSSCFFGMSFTADVPTGNVNPRTATLNVTDNGVGNPQAVSILGLLNVATVVISPVNFGPVGIGTTSPTINATLLNFSGATLNVDATGITISGTNKTDFQFVPAAPGGNPQCPALASFSIPANTLCDVGLVFTPSIAGNESATISVSDNGPGSPQSAPLSGVGIEITSILPPIVATGGPAFTLTVNGGGFAPSAVVNVNGSARLTTFISANELLASIPASDIATAGTLAITVTSPNPGGTTSEPKTLFIAQAPPANNDNINFALFHRTGATTFRTASGSFTGGGAAVTLTWSAPFANTLYTAICTTEVIPGIFSLPTITGRTGTTITVVPAPGGTPSGIIACMAIPDSDASTVRKARVPITSATNVTVTWSPAFSTNAYAAVCSVESASAGVFTSVISTFSPASIVVDNSTYASGTMHCIGIPKDGTYPSNVRAPKTPISGSPQGVAVTFGVPFNGFTNDNTDYVAACSDVEPGVVSSTASLAILAGSKTVNGFTVINGIPSGTLDCIAVPLGGSANSRFTEDTTQTTAQLAAITSPASLATPIDPIPSCAPGTATLQGRARSVWQVYTAPENGTAVADTRFSSYPTILSAWTLSAALPSSTETFTQLACASGNVPAAGASPVQSSVNFNVTKGTTYYLMVSDATPATAPATAPGGILTFSIDAGDVAPPNDDNATPITITPAQLPYSNTVNSVLATPNTNTHNDPVPPCAPGGAASGGQANSVWYTFTPSSNGTITADTLTSPYETILNVTSGTPNGTQVGCNQSAAAGITQSKVSFAATSGTQYFFMISSVLGDGGTTNFHLTFSGAAIPSISFNPTPVNFGNQQVGIASPVTNVTVTNSSTNGAALHITGTSTAGGNSLDFLLVAPTIAGTPCPIGSNALTLAQGAACVMGMQFQPTASGARNSNFNVNDDAAGSPQSVPLSGTGTQPSISFSPTPVNFGNQQVGTTSAVMNVTVTNNTANGDPLHITGTSITGGTNTLDFTLVPATIGGTACPNGVGALTLAQGASCVIGIQFKPSVNGAENSNFSVTDDAAASPQSVPLNGTGTQPSISFNPTSLNFGNVTQGVTSTTMNVTVTNNTTNGNPLHITGTSIAGGTNTLDFTLVAATIAGTPCPIGVGALTLAPAASCVIGITFKPSTTGAENSNFNVNDDAAASPQSVPLSGTGVGATNPVPKLTSFSPANATAGGAAFNLVITGTNFVSGATGTFNGNARTVTFNSATQVTMAVTAADIATAGSFPVIISNPAPGGGPSTPLNFLVNNPAATLTSLSPSSTTVGGAAFNLIITGSNFVSGATGTFNGNPRTVTFNSSTQVTMAVTAPDIAAAGSFPVVISNPAPGGGSNGALLFNVNNVVPNITSIAPTSATVGGGGFNLTVTGTGYISGSAVKFNGTSVTTTFNSSTQLTAAIPAALIATVGSFPVTVTNPAPGGGVSNSVSFNVTAGPPASMTANAGTTPQSATINTAFANALAVTVKDAGSNPVSGVNVTFTAPGSGASGKFSNNTATITVATNASGVASAPFTANGTAGGPYTVTAAATGLTTVNFSLTNNAGAAASMTANAGTTPQSATINTAFANALAVTVTDAGSNPVSGVNVTFNAPGSGASGKFSNNTATITVATNASGVASAPFTANATAGGPYTVTAAATGLTTVNFSLTNTAGAAAKVTATSGSGQNATISTAFAAPLVATVADSGNNPVSGVVVTFTPPGSGASGTFAGGVNTATTNASGVATSATFTANSTAGGPYNVVASTPGATSANFALTNKVGAPAKVAATSGTPQSAAISTAFPAPLAATVTDAGNNPVSGVVVTFTPPGSGASGTFAGGVNTATTNASGVATSATFTANSTAGGPYNVVASTPGATSANFALTNTAAAAAKVAVTSGSGQNATINTAFAAPLVATVTDSGNNPVSGVVVTFTPPGSGASGTFAGGVNTATSNASGVATSATFTANSTAGSYNVVASAAGATSANFAMTNTAGAAAKVTATSGTPQSAAINTAFAAPLVATVTDSGNNPVSGVVVTFTPPGSGASGTFAGGVNTATTNASGVATSPTFTANATVGGPYNVVASAAGATSANFSLTNNVGVAATITATAGTPQSATINTAFTTNLQATVKDAGGNLVPNVSVTFTAPAPGSGPRGTFPGGAPTASVNTNASGVATAPTFTANATAGGPYNVNATVVGVATPAQFALTNLTGPSAKVAATSGTPQSTAINTAFGAPLVATVTDAGNNPVSGVVVTFTPPASGASGTFAGGVNTATTNASGVATSTTFTANATAGGPYNVVASTPGATSANFALTNTAGAPAKVAATSGTPQSATINTAFAAPLVATVTDAGNNPVSGVVVTFTPPGSGASGTFAGGVNTATTNASGVATSATFTANATVGGPYNVVASATGATSANFALSNTAGPPSKVAATSGSGQNATINTAFAAPLVATVTDVGNNPVSGVVVTFTPPSSGASGTFAGGVNTATTNASGVATSTAFTANSTAGGPYNVVASVTGATSANFSLTNKTGPPAKVAATSGTPQSATINTAFASPLVATVTDAGNNLVSGVVVTFTPPGSGASGTFAGGVNLATTNASGVASSAVFTANGTAGGPYNVVASVTGATSANFALTNNNPVPSITSFVPANAAAGGAAFALSINGANFVSGATGTFNGNARTVTFVSATQVTMAVTAADIAAGGNLPVIVTNPGPGGGASAPMNFTVNNPTPTLTSAKAGANTHAPGGAGFTLTVTGTLFVSTSVINFNGKAEPTTFVSATQLTAAIPASDVGTAGTFPVTVTNPAPGGGTTAAVNFTIDGYTVAGPATPPSVKAGQPATIQLTVTPSANGFANAVTFAVTAGLPLHSGPPTFSPASVTPGSTSATTTLTIPTTAGGSMPPTAPMDPPTTPLVRLMPLLWLLTLIAATYAMRLARRMPQLRRYAVLFPLALLLITGAALAGCIGGKQGTPKGPAQLTITATSGTMTQTTTVTLTVN